MLEPGTAAKSISLKPLGEVVEWRLTCPTVAPSDPDTFWPNLRIEIRKDNLLYYCNFLFPNFFNKFFNLLVVAKDCYESGNTAAA